MFNFFKKAIKCLQILEKYKIVHSNLNQDNILIHINCYNPGKQRLYDVINSNTQFELYFKNYGKRGDDVWSLGAIMLDLLSIEKIDKSIGFLNP